MSDYACERYEYADAYRDESGALYFSLLGRIDKQIN